MFVVLDTTEEIKFHPFTAPINIFMFVIIILDSSSTKKRKTGKFFFTVLTKIYTVYIKYLQSTAYIDKTILTAKRTPHFSNLKTHNLLQICLDI